MRVPLGTASPDSNARRGAPTCPRSSRSERLQR